MWKGRFSEDIERAVLDFTQSLDLDWRLALADVICSAAHVRMLFHVKLISPQECGAILSALRQIADEIKSGEFVPKVELEDVHMNIEARLIELLGAVGAKLHTGRSRNDQIATTMRLYLREELSKLGLSLCHMLEVLLRCAERHVDVVVPGYTHLQQAQPISMGHYWMAQFWAFVRDSDLLLYALKGLDESPLGSGALAGSTLPLDRHYVAGILRFSGVAENSIDAISQRDYMLDYHHFALSFMLHCSRLCEDLIIWNTSEFGWIRLPDGFCTGSSMMPQKKNPDVLELVRGRTSQAIGCFVSMATLLKGLPMAYDRDLQEDKRSLWTSLELLASVMGVLPPLLSRVDVDERRALDGFRDGFALATDVAEYLVAKGVPFREAHQKVGRAVKWCLEKERALNSLSVEEWKALIPEVEADLIGLLVPEVAVERRRTFGGTAFAEVRRQIESGKGRLEKALSKFESYRECDLETLRSQVFTFGAP